jgi:hypothetical protein
MDVYRVSAAPCPQGAIAIAINPDKTHTGVVFEDQAGNVRLCDFMSERRLAVRQTPPEYFWTQVSLRPAEVEQISAFVEMVIDHARARPLPYSFMYTRDAFDVTGGIRDGAGLTCVTFIVAIFERLKLPLVDVVTWKARPDEDEAFRATYLKEVAQREPEVAGRLMLEQAPFRIKPTEICGAAGGGNYPVRFARAIKLSKTLTDLIDTALAGEQRQ